MNEITPAVSYGQTPLAALAPVYPSEEQHDFADEKKAPSSEHADRSALSSHTPDVYVAPAIVKIEALSRIFKKKKLWFVYVSLGLAAYIISLDNNTTYNYLIFATSAFNKHSALSGIQVAESIIGSVGPPFVARISDITSRPTAYFWSIAFYIIGYAIVAGSSSVAHVAAGTLFIKLGQTGLNFLNFIMIADLTTLEWRGFWTGFLSTPYIINAFISAKVVAKVTAEGGIGWRWGYGMFSILTPICLAPLVACTYYAQIKAAQLDSGMQSDGVVDAFKLHLSTMFVSERQGPVYQRWWDAIYETAVVIDAIGLILLAASTALFLLPFTLAAYQPKGFAQPSMIAMMTIGIFGFIVFAAWEKFCASRPIMPKRIAVNRAFINATLIDFWYLAGGTIPLAYMSSYVFVGKNWPTEHWAYYNNTLGVALCLFCVPAGLVMRYTHRYKWLQMFGLAIRIIGSGIAMKTKTEMASDAAIIMSAIIIGMGGAISVVCSQVAVQASVPRSDVAAVSSLLTLWSELGRGIGYAVSGAIWTNGLPDNLTKRLGDLVPASEIPLIFGSTTYIRETYEYGTPAREAIITAYTETQWPLMIIGVAIAFLPLISAAIMPNYRLGKEFGSAQVAGQEHADEGQRSEKDAAPEPPADFWGRVKALIVN